MTFSFTDAAHPKPEHDGFKTAKEDAPCAVPLINVIRLQSPEAQGRPAPATADKQTQTLTAFLPLFHHPPPEPSPPLTVSFPRTATLFLHRAAFRKPHKITPVL